MKNAVKSAALGMFGMIALQGVALACPHSETQFICPGDAVVDPSGLTGIVIGINVIKQEASMKYDAGYSNAVLPIKNLALQAGCVGSVCVGDQGADSSGLTGRVIALNPYNYKAAFKYDAGYSNAMIPLENLSVGMGCLEMYCVGDAIADTANTGGLTGKLIAINYSSREIVMKYDAGYSNATLKIEDVALGLGCINGNCVSDKGTDTNGLTGKIIAVNPHSGMLVFKYDAGYSNALIRSDSFIISEYCTTYGDADRAVPQYFEPHGQEGKFSLYTSENSSGQFFFSMDRE